MLGRVAQRQGGLGGALGEVAEVAAAGNHQVRLGRQLLEQAPVPFVGDSLGDAVDAACRVGQGDAAVQTGGKVGVQQRLAPGAAKMKFVGQIEPLQGQCFTRRRKQPKYGLLHWPATPSVPYPRGCKTIYSASSFGLYWATIACWMLPGTCS